MGRASSSKKVARAARAGGSSGPKQRKLGFPVAIVVIVVIGVSLVAFARNDYSEASQTSPRTDEHWHTAYGVYVCDTFQTPVSDVKPDATGVHTHGDGVIHIHPFTAASAGKNTTLSKWGETVGMTFSKNSITLQDGTELTSGFDCNGNTDTELVVYKWPADDLEAEPIIYTENFGSIRLDRDREAITIALVPKGTDVPRPESVPVLDNLDDTIEAPSTTVPAGVDPNATQDSIVIEPDTTSPDGSAAPDDTPASDAPTSDTTTVP